MTKNRPLEVFLTTLKANLTVAVETNPEKYAYGVDRVPQIIERYRTALTDGAGIHLTGEAVIATCKQLGFKPNDRALKNYLGN